MKCLHGSNNLFTLYQIDRTWFDETAVPRPDMNIKVTPFTVTQKLYNTV